MGMKIFKRKKFLGHDDWLDVGLGRVVPSTKIKDTERRYHLRMREDDTLTALAT